MVSAESLYPPTHGYESMEKTTQRRLRGYNRKKRGQGIAGERRNQIWSFEAEETREWISEREF